MSSSRYQAVDGMSYALDKNRQRASRSKWIVVGSIAAILVLIGVGVGVGVTVANNNKNNGVKAATSTSGSKPSNNSTSSGPKSDDPNDPSNFVKDPRYKKSFYGLAYTPEGSQLNEGCSSTLENVIKDIQIMSQLTTRVRLYGADCNQSALVLEAIRQTKTDIQVFLGNYVIPDDDLPYTRQRDLIKDALIEYGADHVAGITVGNEFMLNYVSGKGLQAADVNSPIGDVGADILLGHIADTKTMVQSLNLGKDIPIGNSDAGSWFSNKVLQSVQYGLANVHPWFANVSAEISAGWTAEFFNQVNVVPAAALPNRPKMYIAETGWPTKSSDLGNANNGASEASVANLQIFLDTFVCQANQNGTGYFFFEFFDEGWKDRQFGGVEGWWGLFNADRTLKDVTIPDCPSP